MSTPTIFDQLRDGFIADERASLFAALEARQAAARVPFYGGAGDRDKGLALLLDQAAERLAFHRATDAYRDAIVADHAAREAAFDAVVTKHVANEAASAAMDAWTNYHNREKN